MRLEGSVAEIFMPKAWIPIPVVRHPTD